MGSVEDSTVTAGDSHTLQCTVTEIPHLAARPTVELIGPGSSSVVATVMGLMVTHTVDPVRTSNAGQYTCRASVDIPSVSVDVSGQSSSTLTVQSKFVKIFNLIECMKTSLTPSHPVPQPGVEVTLSRTTTLYAGTSLTLTCTVTLDSNVDSGERVKTSWSGLQGIPEQCYSVTGASGSGGSYTGSLTISPLADQDDGTYTCTVTLTGGSNVLQATASDDIIVTVMGKHFLHFNMSCASLLATSLPSSASSSSDHISCQWAPHCWAGLLLHLLCAGSGSPGGGAQCGVDQAGWLTGQYHIRL